MDGKPQDTIAPWKEEMISFNEWVRAIKSVKYLDKQITNAIMAQAIGERIYGDEEIRVLIDQRESLTDKPYKQKASPMFVYHYNRIRNEISLPLDDVNENG